MQPTFWYPIVAVVIWLSLTVALRLFARAARSKVELQPGTGVRLVVLVHGFAGRHALQPAVDLARETFPDADILTIQYDVRRLSNGDVFEIANLLESEIDSAFKAARYESIVLVGHSMGACIARKVLLWGHGLEQDRNAPKGKREWVDKVVRFVSLAGMSRGWSFEKRPEKMGYMRFLGFRCGGFLLQLTGTGRLIRSVRRGSPFIADARVQWIRLTRQSGGNNETQILPQVIHLLGNVDDIVLREDATDMGVAKDTIFVTLPDTNHADIASALAAQADDGSKRRRESIRFALLGELEKLSPDRTLKLVEDPNVKRVVYLMHGIRDHGGWTNPLRKAIEKRLDDCRPPGTAADVAVVNDKYGYFPMLRFLLYSDRQKNVRKFMDEYTENLAHYPNAKRFDFVGHSNGTYILASALQRYRTISIGRVYFAGSVVPKHYPWRALLDQGRVDYVTNVAAAGDYVVALLPKLFEQIADWRGVQPVTGALDIGAAGFRGFEDAADPQGRVRNVEFAAGRHSIGVNIYHEATLRSIVSYVLDGRPIELDDFQYKGVGEPRGWLDFLSNISWVVWLVGIAIIAVIGYCAFLANTWVGIAFVLVLFGLLMSV